MRTRRIIAERPAKIPKTWTIMNAPRPLMGHEMWTGDFISGVFYVGLNKEESSYDTKFDFNQSQDATILHYTTQQEVVDEMIDYYQARPKLWERLKDHDFNNPEIQEQLVEAWYNLEMNWREQ